MALSNRQRRRISLGLQTLLFVVVVVILMVIIDWGAVQRSFFNFEPVRAMFPEVLMYSPYHEMGIDQFIDAVERRRNFSGEAT